MSKTKQQHGRQLNKESYSFFDFSTSAGVSNISVVFLSLWTKLTRIGVNSPSSANRPYE